MIMTPDEKSSLKKTSSVYVVDDHPIVRQGLVDLINQQNDLMVCGQSETAEEALEDLKQVKPSIMIVDISLKGMNGLELVKNIYSRFPAIYILVLSMHSESHYAERAIRAGAKGYMAKDEAVDKVLTAIRMILKGKFYLREEWMGSILLRFVHGKSSHQAGEVSALTNRELEVFESLGKGIGTRDIAEKLSLSVKTIETYRERIKDKLNLKNAAELLQRAVYWVQSNESGQWETNG
jgi:DNA-binding NarL/FixJ family response regulator